MLPILSVVIPTYQRDDQLAQCLKLLAPGRQSLASELFEVIVTDDAVKSPCELQVRERFSWALWTEGPHRGPAANRNHGASLAKAPWIVFCDDDCLPNRELLQTYVDAMRAHPDCCVFEGRTIADRPKRHPFEGAPINERGGHLWSCNLAIAAEYFHKLGGFNEEFPYAAMEDVDLKKRIADSGVPILFLPEAEIIHPWRIVDLRQHTRRHVLSLLIYARLHPDEQNLFSFGSHLRNVVRYYLRDFPTELREFGWLAIRCQPLRWWEIVYRGWHLARRSKIASIAGRERSAGVSP